MSLRALPNRSGVNSNRISKPSMPSTSKSNHVKGDLLKLCRICAKTHQYMVPIFNPDGSNNNITNIISMHLPIQVNVDDNLPRTVCSDCASGLLAWQTLINTCLKADIFLKSNVKAIEDKEATKTVEFLKPAIPKLNDSKRSQNPVPKKPEPNFICTFCKKGYDTDEDLRSHLFDQHSDDVFICDECEQCVSRSELVPHMSCHAEQEDNSEAQIEAALQPSAESVIATSVIPISYTPTIQVAPPIVAQPILVESYVAQVNILQPEPYVSPPIHTPAPIQEKRDSVDSDHCATSSARPTQNHETHSIYKSLDSNSKREIINNYKKSVPWVKTSRNKEKICPICAKMFSVASSFHYHMKHYHGGIKEHTCDTCGKKFSMRSALIEHCSRHGMNQFGCLQCGKQFRSNASLYIHTKNKHEGDKKFICDICEQSFNWKQKLLRHLLTHTKEKRFLCSMCSRSFAIKYDLTRHMKTHNSNSRFECEDCGTLYSQRRYLKAHKKRKHPD